MIELNKSEGKLILSMDLCRKLHNVWKKIAKSKKKKISSDIECAMRVVLRLCNLDDLCRLHPSLLVMHLSSYEMILIADMLSLLTALESVVDEVQK